ncbi:MAG: glycosyltransferase family 8 protein [Bacteroidetes bacterium]|nr:glycosyltransferase family 8 protein [Bacteroidota bacterium]
MVVCFCLNNLGALGLGASLASLIKQCSYTQLKIYFLCSLLDEKIKDSIARLLSELNFTGSYIFIDFDAQKVFGKYKPLQSDWAAYGCLLIPELINEEKVLYLDTDLIIETDISDIFNESLQNFVIGAVPSTPIQYALEHNFFCNTLGIDPTLSTFNSGVLFINIERWRVVDISDGLRVLGEAYPQELLSADQALLNAYFAGNFFKLDEKYNVHWYPNQSPVENNGSIFHFVGSPKPWDYFGKYLHSGYDKWKVYSSDKWYREISNAKRGMQLRRAWAIRKSYLKTMLKRT